jgi:hypothetical protein
MTLWFVFEPLLNSGPLSNAHAGNEMVRFRLTRSQTDDSNTIISFHSIHVSRFYLDLQLNLSYAEKLTCAITELMQSHIQAGVSGQ